MSSFFDKKEDYINDDFESEKENFLNPSMKNINERNQLQKKRKIKNSQEGVQFIDLASLDNKKVFKASSKTIEDSEYISMILRGFVFIFMFLISLLGIFLIFKTPYYSMYNQKEPIILEENKELTSSNPFLKSQEDLKKDIINQPEESNVKVPTGVVSQNKKSIDKDAMLRREFEDSKVSKNTKDTELTTLLKNNVNQNNSVDKDSSNSKDVFNRTGLVDKTASTKNDSINNHKTLEDNKNTSNSQHEVSSLKGNTTQNTGILQNNRDKNLSRDSTSKQVTWLVTIYSTPKQDEISDRLIRLKNIYKTALDNTTFYFTENKTDNGIINYRIGVTKTQKGIAYPSFNNAMEAKSFCDSLKRQGLDCFVSTIYKSLLPKTIIK